MELRIPATGVLDVDHTLAVLRLHSLPGQESLNAATAHVRRVLRLDGYLVEAGIFFSRTGIQVDHDASPAMIPRLKTVLDHWLGLSQDTAKDYGLLRQDPMYRALAEAHPHLRLISYPDLFEAIATAVIGQQVSIPAARTLAERYLDALGDIHPTGLRAFPTAQATAACTPEQLREIIRCQLAKANALHAAARWYCNIGSELRIDSTGLITQLQMLRGVGPWTKNYVALRGLREEDIFLASDLVVRRALMKLHNSGFDPTPPPTGSGSLATVLLWACDTERS